MVCHDRTEAIPHKLREISGFCDSRFECDLLCSFEVLRPCD